MTPLPKPVKPEKAARTPPKPKCICGHPKRLHTCAPGYTDDWCEKCGAECQTYIASAGKFRRSAPARRSGAESWTEGHPESPDPRRPGGVLRAVPVPRKAQPIKRKAKVRKKSKRPLRLVRDDVWALFAAYVKERDGNVCFSCGKGGLESQNWHAGHMFASGNNAILRYEPKNVHSQCGRCNCFLGGNGAAYVAHFLEVYGLVELERINGMRGREKKWSRAELEEMGAALKRGGADFECWYAERYGLQREA